MSSLDTWNNAKSIVQKLLGPQATLPKFRVDLAPEIKAMIDGRAEFYKAIDGFLAASTKFEETNSKAKFAAESGIEVVKQAHFGLDPKGDQKKIDDGRKIFLKVLTDFQTEWRNNLEYLKKIDHIVNSLRP